MTGLFIPDPDPDFLPIPDPGSRGQKGNGSATLINNGANVICFLLSLPLPPPNCHLFTSNCLTGAGLPIHMIGEVS